MSREHRSELNSLRKLSPFIDEEGLIRVGGRLQHRTCNQTSDFVTQASPFGEVDSFSLPRDVAPLRKQLRFGSHQADVLDCKWTIHRSFLSEDLFLLFFETGQSGKTGNGAPSFTKNHKWRKTVFYYRCRIFFTRMGEHSLWGGYVPEKSEKVRLFVHLLCYSQGAPGGL